MLSILTLNNYDPTIWDGLEVPTVETYKDGLLTKVGMDKDTLVSEILMQCAELELVYPDLEIMRTAIANWSKSEGPIWLKLYKTTILEYNPLWNVDATIEEHNSGENTGSVGGTNTDAVTGFNSTAWQDHDKTTIDQETDGSWSETRSLRRTGNIGVTSSMELIRQEREVSEYNIYKYIVNSFKKRFCLLIY